MVNAILGRIMEWVKENKFLTIILALAAVLLFINLGGQYLYIDEANTAYLAKNTLEFGYPRAYDGRNILPPFFDGTLSKDLAWVEQPWVQYYVAAASMALFGTNTFGARFLFALISLLSIIIVYLLALRIHRGDRDLAILSVLLLTLSVPFILFARSSRYYALVLLFGPLMVLSFLKWVEDSNPKNFIFFVLSSVFLFYSYFPFWVCLTFTIILYFLFFIPKKGKILSFIGSQVLAVAAVVPWFAYAKPGAPLGVEPTLMDIANGFLVYFWKLHTYILPSFVLLLILFVLWVLCKFRILQPISKERIAFKKEYLLFLSVILYMGLISMIPLMATQYLVPAVPFAAILLAFFFKKIWEYNNWVFVVVLIAFLFTNILHISPFILIDKLNLNPGKLSSFVKSPHCDVFMVPSPPLKHFIYDQLEIRSYFFDHLYQLTHDYDTRIEGIIEYLKKHGNKDQTVLSWFGEAGSLMFHTDMIILHHPFPFLQSKELKKLIVRPAKSIDWITPGGLFWPKDMARIKPDPKFGPIDIKEYYKYNPADYEKIYISYPKMYFDPQPNIEFHEFRTVTNAPHFYILKRKGI